MHKKYDKHERSSGKSRKQQKQDAIIVKLSKDLSKEPYHEIPPCKHHKVSHSSDKHHSPKSTPHKVHRNETEKSRHRSRKEKSEKEKLNLEKYFENTDQPNKKKENSYSLGNCNIIMNSKKNKSRKDRSSESGIKTPAIINLFKSESSPAVKEKKHRKRNKESNERKTEEGEKISKHRKSKKVKEVEKNELNNAQVMYSQIVTYNEPNGECSKRHKPSSKDKDERRQEDNRGELKQDEAEDSEELEQKHRTSHRQKQLVEHEDKHVSGYLEERQGKKKRKKEDRHLKKYSKESDEVLNPRHSQEVDLLQEKMECRLKNYFDGIQDMIDKKFETFLNFNKSKEELKLDANQMEEGRKRIIKRKPKKERDEKRFHKADHNTQPTLNIQIHKKMESSKSSCVLKNKTEFRKFHILIGNEVKESKENNGMLKKSSSDRGFFNNDGYEANAEQPKRTPTSASKLKLDQKIDDIIKSFCGTKDNKNPPKKIEAIYYDCKGGKREKSSEENSASSTQMNHKKSSKRIKKSKKIPKLCKESFIYSNLDSAEDRLPKRKLECRTVSIFGIPSQLEEKPIIVTNLCSTSTKIKENADELLEKRKKTNRFRLYYKYSENCNQQEKCLEDYGVISDSHKVVSSEESDNDVEKPTKFQNIDKNGSTADSNLSNCKKQFKIPPITLHIKNFDQSKSAENSKKIIPKDHNAENNHLYPIFSSSSACCLREIKSSKKCMRLNKMRKEELVRLYENNSAYNSEVVVSVNSLEKKRASIQTNTDNHQNLKMSQDSSLEFIFQRNKVETPYCGRDNDRESKAIKYKETKNIGIGTEEKLELEDTKKFTKGKNPLRTTEVHLERDLNKKAVEEDYKEVAIETDIFLDEMKPKMCDIAVGSFPNCNDIKREINLNHTKHAEVKMQSNSPNRSILKKSSPKLKSTKNQVIQVNRINKKNLNLKSIALNTSWYEFNKKSDNTSTTGTTLKTSKSDTNINSKGSQLKSVSCLRKCDTNSEIKSCSQSLDQYSIRPHQSTFFLTKDYRTTDLNSYQRRKIYDDTMRRKMKRKVMMHKKQFGPQVFEVRFLTVDSLPKTKKGKSDKTDFASKIPVKARKIGKKTVTSKKPAVKREYMTTPLRDVDSLRRSKRCHPEKVICEIFRNKSNFRSSSLVSYSCSSLFTSEEPNTTSDSDTGQNFSQLVEMICNVALKCYNNNNRSSSSGSQSNCARIQFKRFLEKTQLRKLKASKQNLRKNNILKIPSKQIRNLSCPALNFTYDKDMILGFALDNAVNDRESEYSDESGYKSKSCGSLDFFKKPQIAALLKPPDQTDVESLECWDSPDETEEEKLKKPASNCEDLSNKHVNFRDLQPILNYNLTFSNTNLNTSVITFINPNSLESNLSHGNSSNAIETITPATVGKLMAKKFFENLLDLYEKETQASSMLYNDMTFFENDLLNYATSTRESKKSKPFRTVFKIKYNKCVAKLFGMKNFYKGKKENILDIYTNNINSEYQKNLKDLALNARKYFSLFVQAVKTNKEIDDELKVCGLQKLLERIENGQFTFLELDRTVNFNEELRTQIKEAFRNIYLKATKEARKCHRSLTANDLCLIRALVCKYRIGLLSRTDLIATYIGRGVFQTEEHLKAAVTYLIRQETGDVDLKAFENFCKTLPENKQ